MSNNKDLFEKEEGENVTPSWSDILPNMIAILQDSDNNLTVKGQTGDKAKSLIKQEFKSMANAADMWILCKTIGVDAARAKEEKGK